MPTDRNAVLDEAITAIRDVVESRRRLGVKMIDSAMSYANGWGTAMEKAIEVLESMKEENRGA